ncbi:MAG: HNH endonuclease [Prevotellaceae bacterium]|jgi:5-methylcytosine-specific restriction endonuclease McrA|nr:HNH endonuclease [Prevotellaceae bacterium]
MNPEILPITIDAVSNNEPIRFDLAKAPYLLVSGASGQGKVKVIHSIITNLLKLDNVDLLLIAPKQTDFIEYPSVTYANKIQSSAYDIYGAINMLTELEQLILKRNALFSERGVKNIQEYNEKSEEPMSYKVLIAGEFGDFSTSKEVSIERLETYELGADGIGRVRRNTVRHNLGDMFNTKIKRITMTGHSAGIHLVLEIRWFPTKNMETRAISQYIICFEIPSVIDKVVEKHRLAEKLLEKERKKSLEKQTLQDLIDVGMIMQGVKREPIPRLEVEAIYSRDGGKCVFCGSTEKIHIDHIIPFSKGGSNEVENLQLLCQKCNLEKSNKI